MGVTPCAAESYRVMRRVAPPLSLYVHLPWCVKKCPYCDFNSHGLRGGEQVPYADYVEALLADLDADLHDFAHTMQNRPGEGQHIVSIFFGGGTPSLFTPELMGRLLDGLRHRLVLADDIEITLETNPGTAEHGCFEGYLSAGINRLSFGVQSFDDDQLRHLGRIHLTRETEVAVKSAQDAGYSNINLDLMYGLPDQSLEGALADVERAIALSPTHISHYQFTLEPHTAFSASPPPLPDDGQILAMTEVCQARLSTAGYAHYEISAYARAGWRCVHNLNYWCFGDYLGIGAGAHGKLTDPVSDRIWRRWKRRHPRTYLKHTGDPARIGGDTVVCADERPFEYMLNALRLIEGVPLADFTHRTGLPLACITAALSAAQHRGWLVPDPLQLRTTALGQRFLNDLLTSFLP